MRTRDNGRAELCAKVLFWSKRLRVEARSIRVQRMTRKWGSCSTTGTITLAGPDRTGARFSGFCDRPRIAPSSAPDPRPPVQGADVTSPVELAQPGCGPPPFATRPFCGPYYKAPIKTVVTSLDRRRGCGVERVRTRHQAVPGFHTTAQGSRVATSVGGVLTGRGADIIALAHVIQFV